MVRYSSKNEHGVIQFASAPDWLGHHIVWIFHWLLCALGCIAGIYGLAILAQALQDL